MILVHSFVNKYFVLICRSTYIQKYFTFYTGVSFFCFIFFRLIAFFSGIPAEYIYISGAKFLVHDGYRYYKNTGYKGKIYWLCQGYQRFACAARVITKDDIIEITKGAHTHPPSVWSNINGLSNCFNIFWSVMQWK